jgi:hypothetical protein
VFFSFLLGQTSFSLLCRLKSGVFFFFAGCVAAMTVAVYYLFPKTRGVLIEQEARTHQLFTKDVVWGRFVDRPD